MLVAACAVTMFGALGSAQAASAAPYVAYAHFNLNTGTFYSVFGGDSIEVSVGNNPTATVVCVSHVCRQFDRGYINATGSVFGLFFAHGTSRLVEVYACNASGCMPSVWSQQLYIP